VDSNSVVWIVIAVVAVIVVIAVVALLARVRNNRRHAQAEQMREEIDQKTQHVERRDAIAAETAARARAAQAEAEVKAAEAARLQGTARTHHEAATASRECKNGGGYGTGFRCVRHRGRRATNGRPMMTRLSAKRARAIGLAGLL